ncbi:hypothetical protein DUI87_28655 [Hirundo rustica rustica]|uniref:G-protein coupled receptors family 1 profile domain-containing protein n=1 Tax=Hirundo rustica rustica TaxID=333673 RepID=A0A3M0J067_HIRRU|nr:hypothetical protein DUI87_28655 [Hirundo rustica rustica]
MVTLRNLMGPRGHCDTVVPHGIKEIIVKLRGPKEPRVRGDLFSLSSRGNGNSGLHGQSDEMSNSSSISHFLLLALAHTRQLQLLHFCLFLGISLAALLGNGLIISAVACGHHLHTPMFFFLLNLALTDLGYILTTVPKAMHNSLWDTRNIS